MSDSATNLDQLNFAQVEKEVIANELFDAASTGIVFGRHGSACAALTWGYYGGAWYVDGVPVRFGNGTLSLTDNATCYMYFDYSAAADSPPGAPVAFATSPPAGWPGPNGNDLALYEITTSGGAITSWIDWRAPSTRGLDGPAPSGTGYVRVTSGVLDTPSDDLSATAYKLASGGKLVETGTSRTLSASDNGRQICFTNAGAITLNMAGSLGAFDCSIVQEGAGQITFAANSQTMTVAGGFTKTHSAGAMAVITSRASGTFFISGMLA